jgi:S-adenosylmethionine uptake transporter
VSGTGNTHWQGATFALTGFAVLALHDALIKSLVGYSVFQIIFFAVLFSLVPFSLYIAADGSQGNLRPASTPPMKSSECESRESCAE